MTGFKLLLFSVCVIIKTAIGVFGFILVYLPVKSVCKKTDDILVKNRIKCLLQVLALDYIVIPITNKFCFNIHTVEISLWFVIMHLGYAFLNSYYVFHKCWKYFNNTNEDTGVTFSFNNWKDCYLLNPSKYDMSHDFYDDFFNTHIDDKLWYDDNVKYIRIKFSFKDYIQYCIFLANLYKDRQDKDEELLKRKQAKQSNENLAYIMKKSIKQWVLPTL